MFNKGQLEGILLSLTKPEVHLSRTEDTSIGYRVRIRVNFRASKEFLYALGLALDKKGIKYNLKEKEHKSRPRPILSIGGLVNIWKLCELVPKDLPDSKNMWGDFRKIVQLIDEGQHLTLEGFDKILALKGEI